MRVDVLPVRATATEAQSLDPAFTAPAPTWALIGVGGDELAAVGVDLAVIGPGFVVAGPPRSGRSTALVTMARSLAGNGMPLVLVTPRRSPLRALAAAENVLGVLDDTATPETLRTLLDGRKQYAVVVDDAELLYDTPMDEALAAVIREGRDGDCALVAAGTADALATQYRGFVADARRSRSGIIIAPQGPTEGELFGVRLPRNVGGGPLGRGILVTSGELALVQVVLPE
jgi:S-DNA-T family DNA segregation ATPase FtsK/SpoIIIE